jgi:hypothetical protein
VQKRVFQAAELAFEAAQVGLAHCLCLLSSTVLHRGKPELGGVLQQLQCPAQ